MKTGLLPFNVGVMLKGRGINFISKEDYEKRERQNTNTKMFITSEILSSQAMINYIKEKYSQKVAKISTKIGKMLTPINF